jgi:hypothetical protein
MATPVTLALLAFPPSQRDWNVSFTQQLLGQELMSQPRRFTNCQVSGKKRSWSLERYYRVISREELQAKLQKFSVRLKEVRTRFGDGNSQT